MTLKLRSIIGSGDIATERLTLKAAAKLDIGEYAIFQVPLMDGEVLAEVLRAYWFPYKVVEQGDLVVIYTKSGPARSRTLSTGNQAHFFYWGEDESMWNDREVAAVVLRVADWAFKSGPDLRK